MSRSGKFIKAFISMFRSITCLKSFITVKLFIVLVLLLVSSRLTAQQSVEKWGMFEVVLKGSEAGNPYIGTTLSAVFHNGEKTYRTEGFYDGKGIYKIRFMPDLEGVWSYSIESNKSELNNQKGSFTCTASSGKNHGKVRVRNTYHFEYADGTPFYPFGTTIYEWPYQDATTKKQTLESLRKSPFNKARVLAIPPYKERYLNGPLKLTDFPFMGSSKADWDFSRFNPAYFKNLDSCIAHLQDLGIEADLILFRPYDKGKWGFDTMDEETNIRYLKYMIARYGAFRNIWWSLANENSFIKHLTDEDWDRLFQVIVKNDPHEHLRSIHNADRIYDYNKPWITHVSLQYYNAAKAQWGTPLLKDIYRKPVVHDEINYEGNIASRWGRISGEELTFRFWNAYIGGGYATHGESYVESPWISNGGRLTGTSPARINFLRKIVESGPQEGLEAIDHFYETNMAGKQGDFYLVYFGKEKLKEWPFILPKRGVTAGASYRAEIIDTWNMTIKPVKDVFELQPMKGDNYRFIDKNKKSIKLPGRPYMALRIRKVGGAEETSKEMKHELE
ncbi:DUF5060 domain-containing protein [Desertivirga brevis]|uniref:DUF5060 domain-containing protein n=1 Tax=Desertivirga brevis TaxID=2810310 RepID=UPI001A96A1E2|nr:DUF5060 domain-containing protein [Pedobacter sp. SYSU D00873]